MDLAANVICERTQDVDRCTSCQRIIDQLKLLVRSIIDEAVVEERSILGIGIGIYGIVDAATGTVVSSPMFNWHDIDLLQPIEEAFHFPVIIDNGTRAMALGEKMVGHAKEAENFLYVNFGYDIDAALLINGGLYYGASSQAGSLGEAPILLDGQFRTLNELATARGIEEQAIRKVCSLSHGKGSLILDMVSVIQTESTSIPSLKRPIMETKSQPSCWRTAQNMRRWRSKARSQCLTRS